MDVHPDFVVGADGLIGKERRLILFILQSHREQGRPPTVREMMRHMAARSTTPITDMIQTLRRKGVLETPESREVIGVRLRGLTIRLDFDQSKEGKRLRAIDEGS